MILVVIYAPLLFASYYAFGIAFSSALFFCIALVGAIFYKLKKDDKSSYIYLMIAFLSGISYFVNNLKPMQFAPLVISITFLFIFISFQINGSSIPLMSAKKFKKQGLTPKEEEFLKKSHKWWILVLLLNVFLHLFFLYSNNFDLWALYASVGWYSLFALALLTNIAIGKIRIKNEKISA